MNKTYHPGPSPITPEQHIILMDDVQWEEFAYLKQPLIKLLDANHVR